MPNNWEWERESSECRAKRAFSCSLSLSVARLLALSSCFTNVRIRNYNCGILFKTCDEYTWPTPTPGSACPFPSAHTHTLKQIHSHRQPRTWIGLNWKCLSFPPQLLGCLCIDFRRISVSVIEFPLSTVDSRLTLFDCTWQPQRRQPAYLSRIYHLTFRINIKTVWPSSAAAWLLFALSQTLLKL